MAIIGMRCVEDMFVTQEILTAGTLNARIDRAFELGADSYKFETDIRFINQAKAGGVDIIAGGITYAHSKGIKFYLLFGFLSYTDTAGHGEAFRNNATQQNAFLADFEWLLARYPYADGIELEEPHFGGGDAAANKTFWNAMFQKLKVIKDKYHYDGSSFAYGFNCASNEPSNVSLVGIDVNFINTNRLFDFYLVQNVGMGNDGLGNLQAYISTHNQWTAMLPNMKIIGCVFFTSNTFLALPACSPQWGARACYNQVAFDEVKWLLDSSIPCTLYTMDYLKTNLYYWPVAAQNYLHTTGDTAADIIKGLWPAGLNPINGIFDYRSTPAGANIWLSTDGGVTYPWEYGVTPRLRDMPPGIYFIKLISNGTEWTTGPHTLRPGETIIIDHVFDQPPPPPPVEEKDKTEEILWIGTVVMALSKVL